MAAVDREELGKRIDAVIEEFHRRHGRLPSKVQVIAKNDTGAWAAPLTRRLPAGLRSSCSPTSCGRTLG
jgi:hypothetical protein